MDDSFVSRESTTATLIDFKRWSPMMMLLLIESWCRTATERSVSAAGKVVSFSFLFSRNLPCVYRSDRNRLISGSFCWFLFG